MCHRNEERRPASTPSGDQTAVSIPTNLQPILRHEAIERMLTSLDGALVVMVVTPTGATRRRVFLSLSAAQRYADRSAELGHLTRVVLVRLEPVTEVAS